MSVIKVEYLNGYKVKLFFSNGKEKTHDFKSFLFATNAWWAEKYRDVSLFKKVKLDKDGSLVWGNNEMDFSPYDLPAEKMPDEKIMKRVKV